MENQKKTTNSLARRMGISLICGLAAGLLLMMLRENLNSSGQEAVWKTINSILFQDITADQGFHSIGLFYIIGQLFMRGLQMAIVPLVLVSLSLALCSITDSTKIGRVAVKTLIGFFAFYAVGTLIA